MLRKTLLILILAGTLAALLFYKPWKKEQDLTVVLLDRLPVGSIIGQTDLLSLSNELSKTMFYYELPFRDIVSPNIILSQGKKFGIDVQAPIYFFANDSSFKIKEWGVITSVQDSSKINLGVGQLIKGFDFKDTLVYNTNFAYSSEYNLYINYGKDWLLIYQGDDIGLISRRVSSAGPRDAHEQWKSFVLNQSTQEHSLIAEIKTKELEELGVESSLISMTNDSTSFIFKTELLHTDTLAFQLINNGVAFEAKEFTNQLINLNFDVDQLRKNKTHPYRKLLDKLGSKISFPTDALLNCWEGGLAFRRGGIQTIKEEYIESEYDEDFNITEVVKVKDVQVTGFAMQLSMNEKGDSFLSLLRQKGILSKKDKKYRLIYSPPFSLRKRDSILTMYTSKYRPSMVPLTENKAVWNFNYTPVEFHIDSTETKKIYGRIRVPLKKIVRDLIAE